MRSPQALRAAIDGGLLSFPITDFTQDDAFDADGYRTRLDWLGDYNACALFAAGGAGEYFSLRPAEYEPVTRAAVLWAAGRMPVIAAAGMGTHIAVAHAQAAERIGADGLLLLPPYLTEAPQDGLRTHIEAVCKSVGFGVIVYNRGNCRLEPATIAQLAERCPNLIAIKDGIGSAEWLLALKSLMGSRLLYINGMPTAEVYAASHAAMGAPTYSSAIFNFLPRTAVAFHRAVQTGDTDTYADITRRFLVPYVAIRNRQPGYAVSIVKAGARIVGRSGGDVRPPLSPLTPTDYADLAALIDGMGEQTATHGDSRKALNA